MKKNLLTCVAILLAAACLSAPAQADSQITADPFALAEKALSIPFEDIEFMSDEDPFPSGYHLTGPFLYVGVEDSPLRFYIPDDYMWKYRSEGLPDGAVLREYTEAGVQDWSTDSTTTRAAFPLLLCIGYGNSTKYEGDLSVYDLQYAIVFIDSESGDAIAIRKREEWSGGPYMIKSSDYYRDMNGRSVLKKDRLMTPYEIWSAMLTFPTGDDAGAAISEAP